MDRLNGSRLLFCRRLLESQQLLRPESLVVDLRSRLDEILQMGPDCKLQPCKRCPTYLVRKLRR